MMHLQLKQTFFNFMDWVVYWWGQYGCSSPSTKGFHEWADQNGHQHSITRNEDSAADYVAAFLQRLEILYFYWKAGLLWILQETASSLNEPFKDWVLPCHCRYCRHHSTPVFGYFRYLCEPAKDSEPPLQLVLARAPAQPRTASRPRWHFQPQRSFQAQPRDSSWKIQERNWTSRHQLQLYPRMKF